MSQFDCVCFSVIVDDLVLPDGTTCMAQLGGGGPQSLFGFQLAHSTITDGQQARLGLSAGVGHDCPHVCIEWLRHLGVDTDGLRMYDRPTPRSWQVFEYDGRRTPVWRVPGDPCTMMFDMLTPQFDYLNDKYRKSINYHIGINPLDPPRQLLRALRAAAHAHGGLLSVEPYCPAERLATDEEVQALVSDCDIFSPNLGESHSLLGSGTAEEMAARFFQAAGPTGAGCVVIRCAEQGVYAQLGAEGPGCKVPAVADTNVVDVTGAGNAFCGGFLAALHSSPACTAMHDFLLNPASHEQGRNSSKLADGLATASAWGCVSASLMIEEMGVPTTPLAALQAKAQQRHTALLPRILVMGTTITSSTPTNGSTQQPLHLKTASYTGRHTGVGGRTATHAALQRHHTHGPARRLAGWHRHPSLFRNASIAGSRVGQESIRRRAGCSALRLTAF